MTNPISEYKNEVDVVLEGIASMKDGQVVYHTFETPIAGKVRQLVRRHLTILNKGDTIVMSVDKGGKILLVLRKQRPYVRRLEDLCRELMVHVDDEQLYDRALKLLEVE